MTNIQLLPQEVWADVQNYEGLYQISSFGNVKSLPRQKRNGYAVTLSITKTKLLSKSLMNNGYHTVTLWKDSKQYVVCVHRLIALNFIPNPANKSCVNHKNGIKTDNRVENLEWCTRSENMLHAYSNRLINLNKRKKVR